MWPKNSLTERLRIEYPILQAPMGAGSIWKVSKASAMSSPMMLLR